jgi:hypothetical protein
MLRRYNAPVLYIVQPPKISLSKLPIPVTSSLLRKDSEGERDRVWWIVDSEWWIEKAEDRG